MIMRYGLNLLSCTVLALGLVSFILPVSCAQAQHYYIPKKKKAPAQTTQKKSLPKKSKPYKPYSAPKAKKTVCTKKEKALLKRIDKSIENSFDPQNINTPESIQLRLHLRDHQKLQKILKLRLKCGKKE